MSAPSYVPNDANRGARVYASPPRRSGSWMADRPGELTGRQPEGVRLGSPGPDQGFVLRIAQRLADSRWYELARYASIRKYGCTQPAARRISSSSDASAASNT